MKYPRLLFFLAVMMFIGSCGNDDQEGTITLHFKGIANESPLQMFKTLQWIDANALQFTHASFFVSDLNLVKQSGTEFLKDIELVDLSFDLAADAADGYSVQIDNIPSGTYEGIQFGIGVPADLNTQVPADFPSTNPLSRTGYYWEAWSSYIFMKVEGKMDTDTTGDFETSFALHTGSDNLYRTLDFPLAITIEDGKNLDLDVILDYEKILEGINIPENPQNHNPEDTVQILKIVNNLQTAVSVSE